MKTIDKFCMAMGALILASSINAWSQGSEAVTEQSASAVTPSSAPSGKAARQANRALRMKVYAAISRQKDIDAGNINATARNGAVTLNGTVKDAAQIDHVATIARSVPGVTSVNNRLTVSKPFGGQ